MNDTAASPAAQPDATKTTVDNLAAMMEDVATLADVNLRTRFLMVTIGGILLGAGIVMLAQSARQKGWI